MPAELFETIFGEINQEERKPVLQKITEDYPFFSTPYYYLLETESSLDDVEKMAGRTALHFNNLLYLNYLYTHKDTASLKLNNLIEEKPLLIHREENSGSQTQNVEEPMLFEPLHTTDYFASQGIKLSDEIQADDKLGKQLKSFTAWLKTMKKIHEQRLPEGNEQLDLTVQSIAEKSNKEAEIITESMAEVFIGQGKHVRARDIYEKLSLLDPSKSAYFAAKIQQLKEK